MVSRLFSRRLLLISLFASWTAIAAEQSRTIILVRHAERAGGMDPDVGISDEGQCRAQVLATMLADSGIKTIYTSEVKRTQQTAEPLAKKLGIHPTLMPAKDIDGLAAKLRSGLDAGPVLIVGHSNTVPAVIARLGGGTVPPIGDTEFDHMYMLTLHGTESSVISLHYPGCQPKP